MKLKDLETDSYNILDFITYFDSMADTKPYFTELSFKFGERELLTKVEELFLDSGLGGIGMAFDLKSDEWEQLELLSKESIEGGMTETKVTKDIDSTDTVDRAGTNTKNVLDDDYVVAYDEEVDTKQSGSTKTDIVESEELLSDRKLATDTTVTSGYDRSRMSYIMRLFRYYPDYRTKIYTDIVDTLCVKGYN